MEILPGYRLGTSSSTGGTPTPAAPVNISAPVVTGVAVVGNMAFVEVGDWTGYPAPDFTYQWRVGTTPISGATAPGYLLATGQVANTVNCLVRSTNSAGFAEAVSNSIGPVAAAPPAFPAPTGATLPDLILAANEAMTPANLAQEVAGALTWGVKSDSPLLPTGVSVLTTGIVLGTPTEIINPTARNVVFTGTGAGAPIDVTLGFRVLARAASAGNLADRVLTQGVAANINAAADFTGTALTYGLALTSGALPAGLTLSSSTGAITGTPSATAALRTIIVEATNALGTVAQSAFDLTVNSASVTLGALSLSPATIPENAAAGTVVGALSGMTAGSQLTLSSTAGNRFALSGANIVRGSTALDFETAASHSITVTETLSGAIGSPNPTTLTITVSDVTEGATANQATQGGVAFGFTGTARVVGNSWDGSAYIIVPDGATVSMTEPTPARTGSGTTLRNGAMVNPLRDTTGNTLAFDGRANGGGAPPTWPQTLSAGDIVVKAIGDPANAAVRAGVVQEYAVCHIVNESTVAAMGFPLAEMLAPAPFGWAGRTTKVWRRPDMGVLTALRPFLSTSGHTKPTQLAAIRTRLDKFNPGVLATNSATATNGYETMCVAHYGSNTATGGDNYGANIAESVAACLLDYMSETADSVVLPFLRRFVALGSWHFDIEEGANAPLDGDGGHWQFFAPLHLLGLLATGRANRVPDLAVVSPQNQLSQPFRLTAAQVARFVPHNSSTEPFPWRLRGVTVSGNSVTLTTEAANNTVRTGDPFHLNFAGMHCRKANGTIIGIVTSTADMNSNNGGNWTFTLDTAAGLLTGDQVYFTPTWTLAAGDPQWIITKPADFNNFNPSYKATYRPLQSWSAYCMLVRALDLYSDVTFGAMEAVVVDSNAGNHGYPDMHGYYGTSSSSLVGYDVWTAQFWNQHAASLGVGQDAGPYVMGVIGQSENVTGLFDAGSYRTASVPYPTLPSGLDAQVALRATADDGPTDAIRVINAAAVSGQTVNPGIVAAASVWHRGSNGRALRVVDLAVVGTSMQAMMDDHETTGTVRDYALDASVVALATASFGPIRDVHYDWWNSEAAVAKTLWTSRSAHILGINADGSPYVFDTASAEGPIDHCLIDTTGRGFGLLPDDARVHFSLPGVRIDTAEVLRDPPYRNYQTTSTGTQVSGMIQQNATPAAAMRQDFLDRTPPANRGVVTTFPGLSRFGAYSGGVRDGTNETSIHPSNVEADGEVLYGQDAGARWLIAEGYLTAPTLNRFEWASSGAYVDAVFRIPAGSTLTTQRKVRGEAVPATPRPHQQLDGMGFVIRRVGDTLNTERPVYRTDNTDGTLYPTAYRGTVAITVAGADVAGGFREARIRITPVTAFVNGDRMGFGEDGGYGGFILHGYPDYDARLYKDGLRAYVPSLSDGTALGYPGVPVRPQAFGVASGIASSDTTAPTLASSSPADNATGVSASVNPTLTFSESVAFGTGNIVLRQNIGGTWSDVEAFDVATEVGTGAGQVSVSGAVVTLRPTAALTAGREYAIRVASTAIRDLANNAFAGIANDTTVSFTTASSSGVFDFATGQLRTSQTANSTVTAITGGWRVTWTAATPGTPTLYWTLADQTVELTPSQSYRWQGTVAQSDATEVLNFRVGSSVTLTVQRPTLAYSITGSAAFDKTFTADSTGLSDFMGFILGSTMTQGQTIDITNVTLV